MDTTPEQAAALPSLQALQEQLREVQTRHAGWQQAQQLMAAQLAPQFSPFSVYRSREVDVSRHLLLLLDPKGTHGQGSLFWDAWVQLLLKVQRMPVAQEVLQEQPSTQRRRGLPKIKTRPLPTVSEWLEAAKVGRVEREHCTTELAKNKRRLIDLCVHTHAGLLAIENKPWTESVDEQGQLADYAEHLRLLAHKQSKPWMLVYLGHGLPSAKSLCPKCCEKLQNEGKLVCVSWGQLLDALRTCVPKIQAPKVRWFVEDFIQMMERDVMNHVENAEMQHVAQAFSQSPQALQSALLLRQSLTQWQTSQLKKLKQQLDARCKPELQPSWNITEDNPLKKQAHFTLAFPGRSDVVMRVEWFWGFAHEADFYWGVYAPEQDLEQSQAFGAKLVEAMQAAGVQLPAAEIVEAGWPLWSFFSADPLFTPEGATEGNAAQVVHPWISVDREQGAGDFVSLLLKRHAQLAAALKQVR